LIVGCVLLSAGDQVGLVRVCRRGCLSPMLFNNKYKVNQFRYVLSLSRRRSKSDCKRCDVGVDGIMALVQWAV
jgi:hypothetical protein